MTKRMNWQSKTRQPSRCLAVRPRNAQTFIRRSRQMIALSDSSAISPEQAERYKLPHRYEIRECEPGGIQSCPCLARSFATSGSTKDDRLLRARADHEVAARKPRAPWAQRTRAASCRNRGQSSPDPIFRRTPRSHRRTCVRDSGHACWGWRQCGARNRSSGNRRAFRRPNDTVLEQTA